MSVVIEYLDRHLLHPGVLRSLLLSAADFVIIAGPYRHLPQAEIHAKRSLDHPPIPSVKITNLPDLAPTEVAQRLSSAGVRRARVETIGWSKRLGVEIHVRPRTDARSLVEIAVNALRALDVEPGANGWRYFAGAND